MQSFDRVPWDAGYVPSYLLDGRPQLCRSAPGYEDVRPFTEKGLRGRKSNPAVAAGDERDFSCKGCSRHFSFLLSRFASFKERGEYARAPVSKPAQLTYAHMRRI